MPPTDIHMNKAFNDNQKLLQALRKGENGGFEYLYQRHFNLVAALVRQNQGDVDDAREIFQETMIALFKKVRDTPDFDLRVEWSTYIYAIARNLWFGQLRKRKNGPVSLADTQPYEAIDDAAEMAEQEETNAQKHQLVQQMLQSLKQECQDILDAAFFKKLPGAAIAELLGYTEAFVKVKKHRCMEELRKRVAERA